MNTTSSSVVNADLFGQQLQQLQLTSKQLQRKRRDAEIKRQCDLAREFPDFVVKKEPKTERQKEICRLVDEGWPWVSVSKKLGIDRSRVRHVLIKFGRYKPDAKHNGTSKKGTGAQSRQPNSDAIVRRQQKEIQKKDNKKKQRILAAKILKICWRTGKRWERASKTICLFSESQNIKKHLKPNTYARVIRKWPSGYTDLEKFNDSLRITYSREFQYEVDFSNHIEAMLVSSGVIYKREHELHDGTRVDFFIPNEKVLIEAKVDLRTKECHTCVGQCCNYRRLGYENIIVVTPNDIAITKDRVDHINYMAKLIPIKELISNLRLHPHGLPRAGDAQRERLAIGNQAFAPI